MSTKKLKKSVVIPLGRASFPYLYDPDLGREYSDGAWKVDQIIDKEFWYKEEFVEKTDANGNVQKVRLPNGTDVEKAILEMGQQYFSEGVVKRDANGKIVKDPETGEVIKEPITNLSQFKHPLKDLDDAEVVDPKMKGCFQFRAKNKNNRPLIVGPDKKPLSDEQIKKIKGGDWLSLVVTLFPYSQQGGGITAGLDIVQFVKEGEPFGLGAAKHLSKLQDIEIKVDSLSTEDLESVE